MGSGFSSAWLVGTPFKAVNGKAARVLRGSCRQGPTESLESEEEKGERPVQNNLKKLNPVLAYARLVFA